MNLTELKMAIDRAFKHAVECGEIPDDIKVTLQIERYNDEALWSDEEVELHYDNNGNASGCVLTAIEKET